MTEYEVLKSINDETYKLLEENITDKHVMFKRWKLSAERFIRRYYGNGNEFNDFMNIEFEEKSKQGFVLVKDQIHACHAGLVQAQVMFSVYLREMIQSDKNIKENVVSLEKQDKDYTEVFIVHGHDVELREKIATSLRTQNIKPIILSEQTNSGNTIIEKIEEHSKVSTAICLFTGDDQGRKNGSKRLKRRARQNVVFETGYFIAKLGRKNVIIIANNDIEIPSDLAGVVYCNEDDWDKQVFKELKKLGFNIDMNKFL